MEKICGRLRLAGIVKVSFQIYWYKDQEIVKDVFAEYKNGHEFDLCIASNENLRH